MRLLMGVLWLLGAAAAGAQEYRIDRPGEPAAAPVYLTRPVEGRVEVQNLPAVQEVRVVGGLEGPLDVRGQVEVRSAEPLPVQVINLPEPLARLEVEGTVRVDDERPVRVWVANPPPAPPPPEGRPATPFAAFAARGAFGAKDARVRQVLRPPEGQIFYLSDLTLDARPDAVLRVRVLAKAEAVAGAVSPAGAEALPLALLDSRHGVSLRLGTPLALGGEFTVEVEALGPGQGAPFLVVAGGYLSER